LGKVAATLYYHPEDCHFWATCLKHIDNNNLWQSDLCLSYMLAAPTMQLPYIPRNEQEDVIDYMNSLQSKWRSGPRLKASTLARDLHELLNGSKPTPQCRPIQMDAERITGALTWIMGILRVNRPDFIKIFPIRIRYGCSAELALLCRLPGIGVVKATKLARMGITTMTDVYKNVSKVQSVVGEKSVKKVIDAARALSRQDNYDM
jgi:replicative superfamily II helicase